ncbi:hypothetical protein [Haloprofundus salinisoli]|uniref:hypothetical protein n=1 Tax=Haloprofundus salinisoli TaxID=2876193 RepID=UPI001CCCA76A|nr:hypothetical protein [Haloprofundus salinisoli]
MPSNAWKISTWLLAAAIFAYSLIIVQQPLLGVFAATIVYFLGWFAGEFLEAGAFSSTRAAVTVALAVLVLTYSLFVTQEVLLGVLTTGLVVVVAWLTSPTGPLATWRER